MNLNGSNGFDTMPAASPQPQETRASIHMILPSGMGQEWPFLLEQLQADPELWETHYTLEGIRERLMADQLQLWLVRDEEERLFWALSEVWVRAGEGQKVMNVWWMRGTQLLANMPKIVGALKKLVEGQQFHSITVTGRKAWERVLVPLGFEFLRVEMVYRIQEGRRP